MHMRSPELRSCSSIFERVEFQLRSSGRELHLGVSRPPAGRSPACPTHRKHRLCVANSLSPAQLAAGAVAIGGLVGLGARLFRSMPKPELTFHKNDFNYSVISRCATILSEYKNFWVLWNGHVETIWAAWFRRSPDVKYKRELLTMADGGKVALDSFDPGDLPDLPEGAPVVVLLPGLAGGSGCVYVQYSALRAYQRGLRAIVFNSRGTADSPVTTPQFYSASFTGDTRAVMKHVANRYPKSKVMAIGWSLGGNILVNYLGEEGVNTPLAAAVSLCNPFNLQECDKALKMGFSKMYDRNLGSGMTKLFRPHAHLFEGKDGFDVDLALNCKTVRDFDLAITHKSFGWLDVDAYYAGSGSCLSIPGVRIPLLCIQALDDPIAVEKAIPFEEIRSNPYCMLVTTQTGGHLGWVAGEGGIFGPPWSDLASFEWLDSILKEMESSGQPEEVVYSDRELLGKS